MGFKDDQRFLKYVTMGAVGARAVQQVLNEHGHHVVELERNCCSNKIWRTKIKRLRLPDLLCTRCGLRFEVRAKTKLAIKMSHSPENPDRHWDAGLIDEDVVVFVGLPDERLPDPIWLNLFKVGELRARQGIAKRGQRKSAAEGAELDLTWPSWTPKTGGQVIAVTDGPSPKLQLRYDSGRSYTYTARDKIVTVAAGDHFHAGQRIAASSVMPAELHPCKGDTWHPDPTISDTSARYTAVKALRFREPEQFITSLIELTLEDDVRVALEAAGTIARLDYPEGFESLLAAAVSSETCDAPWAMEATFILSELGTRTASKALQQVANSAPLSEVRAAAYWGLRGKPELFASMANGFRDKEIEVREHAVMAVASGPLAESETAALIALFCEAPSVAAGACESLRHAPDVDAESLLAAAARHDPDCLWAISALAGREPSSVKTIAGWNSAPRELRECLKTAWFRRSSSWAVHDDIQDRLRLLGAQNL